MSDAEKKALSGIFKENICIGNGEYVSWEYLTLPNAKNDRIREVADKYKEG